MTQDEFNEVAWAGFIQFAAAEPDARTAFTRATGIHWPTSPTHPIDMMVDAVTGHRDRVLLAFVDWITETQWGLEHAPKAYLADRAARKP